MKFELKHFIDSSCFFTSDTRGLLLYIGDILLCTQEKKEHSYCCYQSEELFNYHGLENALCGKTFLWKG